MAYKTYITEALVCGSRAQNTSDKSHLLFTREAGMLYASARSVREERSKQRFALQEFSHIRVSLVYGKGGWRVTGAESIGNVYSVQESRESRTLVRNTVRMLRRLLQGESPHPELFDDVLTVLTAPDEGNPASREEVMILHILEALGYLAPPASLESVFRKPLLESARELDPKTALERKALIEKALHESQL